jgi:hypothetical protein
VNSRLFTAHVKNFHPQKELEVYFGNLKSDGEVKGSLGASPVVNQGAPQVPQGAENKAE